MLDLAELLPRTPRGDTESLSRPDYVSDLLQLAREAQTREDIAALWAAAQRVFAETRNARVRLRQLRKELEIREALLG